MESSRPPSRKKKKSRGAAAAARLSRTVPQQSQQAGAAGKERRRRRRRRPRAAAGRKFRELQTLVPGGEGLRADRLLLRTAGYILHLRQQVHLLRVLSELYVL